MKVVQTNAVEAIGYLSHLFYGHEMCANKSANNLLCLLNTVCPSLCVCVK